MVEASCTDIDLATKWLRILSVSLNDKIRNHLVANLIQERGFVV